MASLLIGDLAERASVSAPTIRYYESIGLLKRPSRSNGGYRRYREGAVQELQFIRKAQALGFTLAEVAEILQLTRSGKAPCERVFVVARQHLASIDGRIRQLQAFRDHLAAELAKWDGRTGTMRNGVCQIIATADMDLDAPLPVDLTRDREGRRLKTGGGLKVRGEA
jgi:MerR family transcriptional regulator, copper efflux regulator